jgi:hypothetical protein
VSPRRGQHAISLGRRRRIFTAASRLVDPDRPICSQIARMGHWRPRFPGPRTSTAVVTASACAALIWIVAHRAGQVQSALHAVSLGTFGALVVLHLATLTCRSEAWRICLVAIDGHAIPRTAVHGANAGAFCVGALEPHAGMPVRIALLRRLAPGSAPRPGQIAVADVPIFLLEVAGTAVLLAAAAPVSGTWPWWTPLPVLAGAAGLLLGGRRLHARLHARRPLARGLAILAERGRRRRLLVLVAAITVLGALRVLLVLDAAGLEHGLGAVAACVAALGVFGLLPLGPSAAPGATLAVSGTEAGAVGGALAAGLVLAASSVTAVLLYAVGVLVARTLDRGDRPEVRRHVVRQERAEGVEAGVVGAVEVGRPRGQQAVLAAVGHGGPRLGLAVGDVERLHPVEAHGGEAVDAVADLLVGVHVPERVRPDGEAAGLVDQRDPLGHRGRGAVDEARPPGDQVGLDHGADVAQPLGGEAVRVRRVVEDRPGEMRAADGRARRAAGVQRAAVDVQAARLERVRHLVRARRTVRAAGSQRLPQLGVRVVDEVPAQVQVTAVGVQHAQLDGGDDPDAVKRPGGQRLVDAVHRVMVGEREQLDARGGGRPDELPR